MSPATLEKYNEPALVSKPGFDPAAFARGLSRAEYAKLSDDIDKPLFNRALRGTYPSGSTIKPVIALAGLTYHVVDPNRQEFCAGVFHLPGSSHLYREGKGGKHGYVDLERSIAKSCDVYFYGLASTIGVEHIAEFMSPFGYGQLTGIDIGGEKPGLLPSPEWKRKAFKRPQDQIWFPGETVNFGVGQGYLLVTPLQLAHVASVLAERGKTFRPRLVTGVRDLEGNTKPIAPAQLPPIGNISSDAWDLVLRGMMGAATYGTAAAISRGASCTTDESTTATWTSGSSGPRRRSTILPTHLRQWSPGNACRTRRHRRSAVLLPISLDEDSVPRVPRTGGGHVRGASANAGANAGATSVLCGGARELRQRHRAARGGPLRDVPSRRRVGALRPWDLRRRETARHADSRDAPRDPRVRA